MVENDYFLATTALQEYWDKTKPLIFLTNACVPFKSESNATILPDPWREPDALYRARVYTEHLYKKILIVISQLLNEIHHTNHNIRYWEILLGPTLRIYLSVFYDRYTCVRSAYAIYANLQTITLTKNSYAVATTPQEFSSFLLTDLFNLQIYSFILDYLNAASKQRFINVRASLNSKPVHNYKENFKNYIRRFSNSLFKMFGDQSKVLFIDSGVSFTTLLKIFLKSKGKIVPTIVSNHIVPSEINWHLRQKLLRKNFAGSDFERCMFEGLTYFLPTCFLEDYQQYVNQVVNLKPELIFSAMGWHYNEPLKFFAARAQEQGTKLVGHQHGGDYGILDFHTSELHETNITDKYYTWGWHETNCNSELKPFYSLKLRETKNRGSRSCQQHYLYGTANGRRYLLRFNYSISAITNYFKFQQRFLHALPEYLRNKLQVRLYPSDWGWERIVRFQEAQLNLKYQSTKIPFSRALSQAQLYISDHISTTFAESIAINKPTIIVADPIMWGIREEAQPYFAELKRVGIYYDDPIVAAQSLITIDKDVHHWWQEIDRIKVVNEFRQRFCRSASNKLNEWINELLMVSREENV